MKLMIRLAAAPLFAFTLLTTSSNFLSAQQTASTAVTTKPVIEEWVYRTKYGFKDEWWTIFKKYQIAILEKQKQLGYVKEFTVYSQACIPVKTRAGATV